MYHSDISSACGSQGKAAAVTALMSDISGESDCSSPRVGASGPIAVVALIEQAGMAQSISSNGLTGSLTRPRLAVKRARDPPRNAGGQIYCDHPECRENAPVFRRPCEWNKHMDKHDRPYKCSNPDCAKLPGFTYSGGLLRHQREVHGMHTPQKRLMCPFADCNRSSGKGFTRQENLNEHLRRLHRGSQDLTVPPTPTSPPNSAKSLENGRLSALPIHSAMKRKRTSSESEHGSEDSGSNIQALRDEVVRLRSEIQQKDSRLDELERVVKELRQTIKRD
ncbi:Fungal specific transcription factor, putative [Coccidioides posadasii C735 delta SOWgp]|nr:Fungal specific transcription factor, putative [Coccidioides posadasii C735 delta SOWgp]EER27192.1 Fungal specific transcription factor, putative [Coccidioides posadasii C735 delta SOWgp]KMM66929.1 hypothetical protein CPAG_03265 [Coccidioides posadasii RMSCC 3488]|eukprot:XP_003069337.1 Fungal specific transcription factor, putative [Coccidioides posadasii C735 delta SOWgp]